MIPPGEFLEETWGRNQQKLNMNDMMRVKKMIMILFGRRCKTSMNFKDSSLNESDPHESSIAKAVNPPLFFGGEKKPGRPWRLRSWWFGKRKLPGHRSCEVEQLEARHMAFGVESII